LAVVAFWAVLALSRFMPCAQAGEEHSLSVRMLSTEAGDPRAPGNVKLAVELPEEMLAALPQVTPENFRIYIFPCGAQDWRQDKYRAKGLLLWQYGKTAFLDVRDPPRQESAGECSLFIECTAGKKVFAAGAGQGRLRYRSGQVDVALVIDASMSMIRSDPQRKRVAAAREFLNLAESGGRVGEVGVVTFSNRAEVRAPLTSLADKDKLIASLSGVPSDGQTNMDDALAAAEEMLAEGKSGKKAIVFLTDGRNEPRRYQETHLELARKNIEIYSVGLSDRADYELLERMAADTGGKVFRAATDVDLLAIYRRIASEIGRNVVLFSQALDTPSAELVIPVDQSLRTAEFVLDTDDGAAVMQVFAPDGKELAQERYSESGNSRVLRVSYPAPGNWKVLLKSGGGDLPFAVTGDTDLLLDVFPPQLEDRRLTVGATLARRGDLSQISRIRLFSATAPGKLAAELYDDGKHGDGQASDGVFSGFVDLPAQAEGNLRFGLRAVGETGDGQAFVRQVGALLKNVKKYVPPKPKQIAETPVKLTGFALDLGKVLPGDKCEATGVVLLEAEREQLASIDLGRFAGPDGAVLPDGSLDLVFDQGINLAPGENRAKISLRIPPDARPGVYHSETTLRTWKSSSKVVLTVEIAPTALAAGKINPKKVEVEPGDEGVFKLPLTLSSLRSLPLTWKISGENADLFVSGHEQNMELDPGAETEFACALRVPLHCKPGRKTATLEFSCGDGLATTRVEIAYTVLPPPEENIPVAKFAYAVPEKKDPPVEKPVEPEPEQPQVSEDDAGDTFTPPAATVIPKTDAWESVKEFLFWALALLVAGLSTLALLLRYVVKNRLLRFALLSAPLNLVMVILFLIAMGGLDEIDNIAEKPKLVARLVSFKQGMGFSLNEAEKSLLQRVKTLDEKSHTLAEKKDSPDQNREKQSVVLRENVKKPPMVEKREELDRRVTATLARREPEKRLYKDPEREKLQQEQLKRQARENKLEELNQVKVTEANPQPETQRQLRVAIVKDAPPVEKEEARLNRLRRSAPGLEMRRRTTPEREMTAPVAELKLVEKKPELLQVTHAASTAQAFTPLPETVRQQASLNRRATTAELERNFASAVDSAVTSRERLPVSVSTPTREIAVSRRAEDVFHSRLPQVKTLQPVRGDVKKTGTVSPSPAESASDLMAMASPPDQARQISKTGAAVVERERVPMAEREFSFGRIRRSLPVSSQKRPDMKETVQLKTAPAAPQGKPEPLAETHQAPAASSGFRAPETTLALAAGATVLDRQSKPVSQQADLRGDVSAATVDTRERVEFPRLARGKLEYERTDQPAHNAPALTPEGNGTELASGEKTAETTELATGYSLPENADASCLGRQSRGTRRELFKEGEIAVAPGLEIGRMPARVSPMTRRSDMPGIGGVIGKSPSMSPGRDEASDKEPSFSRSRIENPGGEAEQRFGARQSAQIARENKSGRNRDNSLADERLEEFSAPGFRQLRERVSAAPVRAPAARTIAEAKERLQTSVESDSLSVVIGEVKFGSDWDSSPLAVANLVDAYRTRAACGVNVEKRTVNLDRKQVADCQLLFMTGNLPYVLSGGEVDALRAYLAAGGCLWLNDSTREGDDSFDSATRRELAKVLATPLVKIPAQHALLKSVYNFTEGYLGYHVPPGDKYRVNYLEGIELNGRLAVLYTRNDYADGMALDPQLTALRKSTTDLSAEEMQEGSLRFGINVVHYFLGGASSVTGVVQEEKKLYPAAASVFQGDPAKLSMWQDFSDATDHGWEVEKWGNPAELSLAPEGNGALKISLLPGQKRKVAIKYDIPASAGRRLDLSNVQSVILDVFNGQPGGFRFSLVLTTVDTDGVWRDFEAKSIYLRPGWNKNVCFLLKNQLFKSRETGWKEYDTKLSGVNNCGKLSIFYYTDSFNSGIILQDCIRLEEM
jgi:uncharacterized protein YegL